MKTYIILNIVFLFVVIPFALAQKDNAEGKRVEARDSIAKNERRNIYFLSTFNDKKKEIDSALSAYEKKVSRKDYLRIKKNVKYVRKANHIYPYNQKKDD